MMPPLGVLCKPLLGSAPKPYRQGRRTGPRWKSHKRNPPIPPIMTIAVQGTRSRGGERVIKYPQQSKTRLASPMINAASGMFRPLAIPVSSKPVFRARAGSVSRSRTQSEATTTVRPPLVIAAASNHRKLSGRTRFVVPIRAAMRTIRIPTAGPAAMWTVRGKPAGTTPLPILYQSPQPLPPNPKQARACAPSWIGTMRRPNNTDPKSRPTQDSKVPRVTWLWLNDPDSGGAEHVPAPGVETMPPLGVPCKPLLGARRCPLPRC
jgi:hypothetical protein